ncbi:type VI secretion system effector, Hcp1 family [Escherichia coli]|nr:type VI secretion system effector, Hcp1 family [Escherichia coli]
MMSLWDALRMNMMISYQELVRTFPNMQSRIAKGILVGESKITPWAIPSGSIYPPMKNIMDHTK